MHIVQIMLSRGLGGIEQSFIDYCDGLAARGHRITAIVHPQAQIRPVLKALGIPSVGLRNMGEWDPLAALNLRLKLARLKPDVVVCHANRAYGLASRAAAKSVKKVAVAHNYNTRRFSSADAVFAITGDVMRALKEQGIAESRLFLIPNMIRCAALPQRTAHGGPPLIAALGRFVAKKGFDVFIEALAILRDKGHSFRAVIGGAGDEETRLKKLARKHELLDRLRFAGWVEDKAEFYGSADIFCLPSHHEPFGIVLLEAFMYGVPVVTTDSEGPRDIITPNYDALMVPKGDAVAMAAALAQLLNHPEKGRELAASGFAKVKTRYAIESVAERIEQALKTVLEQL